MMISLLKKDYMIAKLQILFMIGFVILALPFLGMRMQSGVIGGYVLYFILLFTFVLLLTNTISIAEATNGRALAYLCATPYSRTQLVREKYLFDISLVVIYNILYFAESLFVKQVESMNGYVAGAFILVVIIFRCVYIPIEIKLGYEKAKFASMLAVMVFPFALPMIFNKIDFTKINLDFIEKIPVLVRYGIVYGVMLLVIFISCTVATRIFEKKELN